MTGISDRVLEAVYSRLNYERTGMPRSPADLRLKRMRGLLRRLGDPQLGMRIVHIAGTKGKGSTATLLAAALTGAGYRTGLYCSPHLHRVEERFRINGRMIEGPTFDRLWDEAIHPAAIAIDRMDASGRGATFFEVTTALGLLYFAQAACDLVVLEVGMGGRLDSTNCVRPLQSVITSISFDHMKQLGPTLGAIAREKAGILKRRGEAVIGVRGEEARGVIERAVVQRRVRARWIDRDYHYQYDPPRQPLTVPEAGRMRVVSWARDWGWRRTPLFGEHQAWNAATTMACLDALEAQGLNVPPATLEQSWAGLQIPARLELLGSYPWLLIDGAHNAASAQALVETVRGCFPRVPRTIIFGTTRDKDLEGQLRALAAISDRMILTRYQDNPRSLPISEAREVWESVSAIAPQEAGSPEEALALARRYTSEEGLIIVTGSLFLAAEMRSLVQARSTHVHDGEAGHR